MMASLPTNKRALALVAIAIFIGLQATFLLQMLIADLSVLRAKVLELEARVQDARIPHSAKINELETKARDAGKKSQADKIKELEKRVGDAENPRHIWAAIRLLEHGIQKATQDWTPLWPVPPKGCSKFPRQLPLVPYYQHVHDQMYYGPMQKMAILADKHRVIRLTESFQCPGLTTSKQYAVWDAANISELNSSRMPSRSFALKANFAAAFMAFIKDGILIKVHTPVSGKFVKDVNSHVGKPVNDTALIHYFTWALTIFYRECKEPHYAFIDKLIIAEELLPSRGMEAFPEDYKFFASMGKMLVAQVHTGRMAAHKVGHVDRDYKTKREFVPRDGTTLLSDEEIMRLKPADKVWMDMVSSVECLSKKIYEWGGIRFARIDLYDLGEARLGEITLTPMSGMRYFSLEQSLKLSAEMPFQ